MSNREQGSTASTSVPEIIAAPTRKSLRAARTSDESTVPYTRRQMRERAAQLQEQSRTGQLATTPGEPSRASARGSGRHGAHTAAHSAVPVTGTAAPAASVAPAVPATPSPAAAQAAPQLTRKQLRALRANERSRNTDRTSAPESAEVAAQPSAAVDASGTASAGAVGAASASAGAVGAASASAGLPVPASASAGLPVPASASAGLPVPASAVTPPQTRRARRAKQEAEVPVATQVVRAKPSAQRADQASELQASKSQANEPQTRRGRREAGLTGQIPVVPAAMIAPPPHTGAIRQVDAQGNLGPLESMTAEHREVAMPTSDNSKPTGTRPAVQSPRSAAPQDATAAEAGQWAHFAEQAGLNTGAQGTRPRQGAGLQEQAEPQNEAGLQQDARAQQAAQRPRTPAVRPQRMEPPASAPIRSVTSTSALPIGDEPDQFNAAQQQHPQTGRQPQFRAVPIVQPPASEPTQSVPGSMWAVSAPTPQPTLAPQQPGLSSESSAQQQVEPNAGRTRPQEPATGPNFAPTADAVPSGAAPGGSSAPTYGVGDRTAQAGSTAQPGGAAQAGSTAQAGGTGPAFGMTGAVPTTAGAMSTATGSVPAADTTAAMSSTLATGSIPVVRANPPSQQIQTVSAVTPSTPATPDDLDPELDEDHKHLQLLHWGIILAIALVLGLVIWRSDFDQMGAPSLEHPAQQTTVTSIASDFGSIDYSSHGRPA